MQTGYDFLCVGLPRSRWRRRGGLGDVAAVSGKIPPRPYGISKGAIQEEFSDEDSYSEYYY